MTSGVGQSQDRLIIISKPFEAPKSLSFRTVSHVYFACGGWRRMWEFVFQKIGPTLKSKVGPASLLFCWRPRRDLNPRYRRERAMS